MSQLGSAAIQTLTEKINVTRYEHEFEPQSKFTYFQVTTNVSELKINNENNQMQHYRNEKVHNIRYEHNHNIY